MKSKEKTFVLILLLAGWLASPAVDARADGKKLFLEKKCDSCHSIQTLKIEKKVSKNGKKKKGPDLSGAGIQHDASSIAAWLTKKETRKSVYSDKKVKHKKKFKGSDAELKELSEFLAQQKTKVEVKDEGVEEDESDG